MKKLNITFCSFPDYTSNAKSLYLYMRKKYKDNMNYTWIVHDKEKGKSLNYNGIKAILIGTEKFKKYIKTTDVFFTTHANLLGDRKDAKKSIYVELWHGIGPKPVGFSRNNINGTDNEWYEFLKESLDYIIVPSEFWQMIFSATFNIEPARIKPLGMPLFDEMLNSDGKKNLEKILNINLNNYKKIILYAPTFKKGCGGDLEGSYNKANILNIKKYNEEELTHFLKNNNYLLLVKRHPSDEVNYKVIENEYIKNINNDLLEKKSLNINNLLNGIDLLITDYSSLGTEFMFLNRPVIYLSTDENKYKKDRGILLGEYDFWSDKVTCDNFEDLIKLIKTTKSLLEDSKRKLFFGNLKNGGCDKICDFFFENNALSKNASRHISKLYEEQEKNRCLENKNVDLENQIKEKQKEIKELNTRKTKLEVSLYDSNEELKLIKNSRSWKVLEKLRRIKRKILGK